MGNERQIAASKYGYGWALQHRCISAHLIAYTTATPLIHRGASRTCTMAVTPPGKSSWPQINVESALKLAPNKYKHRYILGPHHHASRPFQPPARDLLPGLFLPWSALKQGTQEPGLEPILAQLLMGGGNQRPHPIAPSTM